MRIAIIGAGIMAEAMIKGILGKGLCKPDALVASDPRDERRAFLEMEYGIRLSASNVEAVKGASVVIMAVKPQNASTVLSDLESVLIEDQAFISIAAGILSPR